MSSFFRYPGGKSKLRKQILERLTPTSHYREPFFGGGGIGLEFLSQNPEIETVWINDKDIGIVCLWLSAIHYPLQFKEQVRAFCPTVNEFYNIRSELQQLTQLPINPDQIIDIGFKKLAIHQISYSGLGMKSGGPLGGADQKSRYKIDCRWSPEYICKKIDKTSKLLREYEVRCTSLDFLDLIQDQKHASLIYLDPPYYVKGNDLYQHGFTVEDHHRLATALKETNHVWLLSYDDCPEIRELYAWAGIQPLNVNYSITSARTKGELLIGPNLKELKQQRRYLVG